MDLSKAYDTIEWDFLEDLLKALCFPSKFINWIMVCPRGTSYYLMMNGRIRCRFKGKKGLRQGDPISPLLFFFITDYLTRLLQHATQDTKFKFYPMCKSLKLVNLCFVDDLVILCKGSIDSARVVQKAFQEFCDTTGLSANKHKSHIYFRGVDEATNHCILAVVNIAEGSFLLKYLGIPLRPTKWKASDCGLNLKKIQLRLHTWASMHLSFAGRAQLIQSILIGIRSYWMSIFLLPQKFISKIDKLCQMFLWGVKENRCKVHLTYWEQVCLPKEYGGIGFREGNKWNKALLAKYVWAVFTKQDCLWVKWVNNVYLRDQDFWSYSFKQGVRWYFKKLARLYTYFVKEKVLEASRSRRFKVRIFYNSFL
ncbi:uncharacterized protein LOC133799541 [Humulus lupulus]|uniref:uncharacterized protein LOC133799541 n=1 Tax=Humulus lupulus TaxID=3486 RepID=UPI002B40F1E5|nr:uncharacterized protein LOC133799541 [Humulus lupulus]